MAYKDRYKKGLTDGYSFFGASVSFALLFSTRAFSPPFLCRGVFSHGSTDRKCTPPQQGTPRGSDLKKKGKHETKISSVIIDCCKKCID